MSYSDRDDDPDRLSEESSNSIWKRGLIMLLFMLAFGLAQSVLFFVAVVQFLWMLFRSERNVFLAQFGYSIGLWMAETAAFLSGDTGQKPFPWKPWPEI